MNRFLVSVSVVALAAGGALAQFNSGFEPPTYAPGVLTGQDGWYVPVAGSANYNVAAYGGPIAANPTGGLHYAIGIPASTTSFARAQHDLAFDANGIYDLAYDVNVLAPASKTVVNNVGSFSLQDSVTSRFTQSLLVWNDLNNPSAGWGMQYVNIDAAGVQVGFVSPGAGFSGLAFNRWYRQSLRVDFSTNELLSVSITDIATNATTTVELDGVYLGGGENNVLGRVMPTGVRMFAGG